jgi:stage II sporulation protein R
VKSKKHLTITLLIPFSVIFCCTFFILSGAIVAAFGSKPLVLTEVPSVQEGIAEQLLRLHVIANSDSDFDQEAKRIVKDGLVTYMQTFLDGVQSKDETIQRINDHLPELEETATSILRDLGITYNVKASLGPATFPVKVYGDITLPAGEYDALRVQLGRAEGKNWWCIIFPNLCYVDATYQIVPEESKDQLKVLLTDEEYTSIIKPDKTKVTVKFKLLEWFQDLF